MRFPPSTILHTLTSNCFRTWQGGTPSQGIYNCRSNSSHTIDSSNKQDEYSPQYTYSPCFEETQKRSPSFLETHNSICQKRMHFCIYVHISLCLYLLTVFHLFVSASPLQTLHNPTVLEEISPVWVASAMTSSWISRYGNT